MGNQSNWTFGRVDIDLSTLALLLRSTTAKYYGNMEKNFDSSTFCELIVDRFQPRYQLGPLNFALVGTSGTTLADLSTGITLLF
jgi:hypothetical protein